MRLLREKSFGTLSRAFASARSLLEFAFDQNIQSIKSQVNAFNFDSSARSTLSSSVSAKDGENQRNRKHIEKPIGYACRQYLLSIGMPTCLKCALP